MNGEGWGIPAWEAEPTPELTERLNRLSYDFTFHPIRGDQEQALYLELRIRALDLAAMAVTRIPEGRELSLAITKLEEFLFWANAAVARNGTRTKEAP